MRTLTLVLLFGVSITTHASKKAHPDTTKLHELRQLLDSMKPIPNFNDSMDRLEVGMDSLQALAARVDAMINPPPPPAKPGDFIFPWAMVVAFGLCWLLYKNPKHIPDFLYRELWLTVTILCLVLYWGPIMLFLPTDRFGIDLLPIIIGDTVRLLLTVALGYGAFLLVRRMTKPPQA